MYLHVNFLCFLFSVVAGRSITPSSNESEPKWMIMADSDNNLHYVDLHQHIPRAIVPDLDVTFHYKSRVSVSIAFNVDNVDDIENTDFNINRRTMFIIHGWNNNKDSQVNKLITAALLKKDDWNIFVVDWHHQANRGYGTSKASVSGVGEVVAKFVSLLMAKTHLGFDQLYFAGHSLGAHVAGHAGSKLNSQVTAIIGMDPAGPLFSFRNPEDRLDETDAKYVHVIHTNAGLLGFSQRCGHSDFFPNGGMNQIGCGFDLFGTCAHSRSYIYFAESIISEQFLATYCDTVEDWKAGNCDGNLRAHMGGNHINYSVEGKFFLTTNQNEPYALG